MEKINKCITSYIMNRRKLKEKFIIKDETEYNSIYNFNNNKGKANNDLNNKNRETIIKKILENKIPDEYYLLSYRWKKMREEITVYRDTLLEDNTRINRNDFTAKSVKCELKAGRYHNYDFNVIIRYNINGENEVEVKTKDLKVELKSGATCVNECPQFVSPTKPSQYLKNKISFEEYFYDNTLPLIAKEGNLDMPEKEEYLKKIHNNSVDCMKEYKKIYDNDKSFNKFAKKVSKESINKYLKLNPLDTEKLTQYLLGKQKDKYYMCYKNNRFYLDKMSSDNFKITHVIEINGPNIICMTESGHKLEIKLRWKNGNGIQFPAFQIKRKEPSQKKLLKKELIHICETNNIEINKSAKKAEIETLLRSKNLI